MTTELQKSNLERAKADTSVFVVSTEDRKDGYNETDAAKFKEG